MLGWYFEEKLLFVMKEINIFNLKCGNSCKAELHSEQSMFMTTSSIGRKLSVWHERKPIQQRWRPRVLWPLMALSSDSRSMLPLFLYIVILWVKKIDDFKADDQDSPGYWIYYFWHMCLLYFLCIFYVLYFYLIFWNLNV